MIATLNFQDYLKNLQDSYDKIAAELAVLIKESLTASTQPKSTNKRHNWISKLQLLMFRLKEAKELIQKHGSEDVVLAGSLFVYTPQEAVYLFSGSYTEFNKFYAPVALQEHVMTTKH